MQSELVRKIHFIINEKTGLVVSKNQAPQLEQKILKLLDGMSMTTESIDQYVGSNPLFFEQLLEEVLVNESYFFRNQDHFRVLSEIIFPVLIDKLAFKREKSFRALSVGCSTGQEPLSILMSFYETNHSKEPVDIHVDAIDLSRKSIMTALEGEYTRMQSRGLTDSLIEKYFIRGSKDRIKVISGFLNKISYFHGNILTNSLYDGFYDLVFARNTLIYFDEVRREQVKQKLVKSMKSGGYLFLGESEIGYGLSDQLQSVKFNQSIVYRKK